MTKTLCKVRKRYNTRFGCWTNPEHWTESTDGKFYLNSRCIHVSGEPWGRRALRLFAECEDCEPGDCYRLSDLGIKYANHSTRALNGDPHPKNDVKHDKNKNAELWNDEAGFVMNQMSHLALVMGFDRLDFGVGFYPTLQRVEGEIDRTYHFPYDC